MATRTLTNNGVSAVGNHKLLQSGWCMVAAFGAYFCMYGFRKPFTAAAFADTELWGLGLKTVLIIAQVFGYMLSKFIGIKVIAELPANRRAASLLGLVGCAEIALFLFGVSPVPFNVGWLFLSGLALGLVFGLVLGFIEGRVHTEAMAAALCTSFVVADGVTKSVGAWLLEYGVNEFWMPFVAGLFFAPPLLLFVWMLTRIPAPSAHDVLARSERAPMNRSERRRFFRQYGIGLTLLVLMYILITVLRSMRADFAPEIWSGLGVQPAASVYARSELTVALGILILNASAIFVSNNRTAFFAALAVAIAGAIVVALALFGLQAGYLSPFAFMVMHGFGLYLPYIAVHTTIFERLIAMTRERGNIGYLMYLADAFGYLGYVAVMITKNVGGSTTNILPFFITLSWVIAAACVALLIPCWRYFAVHVEPRPSTDRPEFTL